MRRISFCSAPLPNLVYAGPASKDEFDRISLPENPAGTWTADPARTILEEDGQNWERRCYTKTLGELGSGQVAVIFQWFEYRPAAIDEVDNA